jgi:glycerol-3-phosphate dehydrogenase (NAD(P)+)
VRIPTGIEFTTDIAAGGKADIIVFAVPSKFIGAAAKDTVPHISEKAIIVNVSKGLVDGEGGVVCRLSEILGVFIKRNPIVVLTGPCHAEEVGKGLPATVVASSVARKAAEYIQTTLVTPSFRIYLNDDIIGCELGGALKNPIALCCGIASGMGLGDNAAAAIMTRGLAEIKRLGTALGAKWQTFTGLAGAGDMIVTCTSQHSRNNRAGRLIGQGIPAADAIAQIGTVEGYECVKVALGLAKKNGVDTPILEQLYKVCYENLPPRDALECLMQRPQRHEEEAFWND